MALHTVRTDDLTGEPEATTVVIIVNGQGVEVDLADKSAVRLAKALEPFWSKGSPGDYVVTRKEPKRRASTPPALAYDRAELVQWAETNGVTLPSRGRVPNAVLEHFHATK